MMDDSLNPKHFQLLQEWEEKVDLCLALGTSLCGMRSDGIAAKAAKQGKLVIINLQQTPYDETCHLRLYGNLQNIL
jgi:NAD-dependent SIR2 family protein deacetylase